MNFYNRAQKANKDPDHLYAMKLLLNIPDDRFFKEHYTEAYPLWLIQETFKKKEEEKHFKIVHRLIWTTLRLGFTYELVIDDARTSLKEAIDRIVGSIPLKTKKKVLKKDDYLCGEKTYGKYFSAYKSVCHFLAAFEHMGWKMPDLSRKTPKQINKFLCTSLWFRERLLWLYKPNVKGNIFFTEEMLIKLPAWVNVREIEIPIQPFKDKLQELQNKLSGITNPKI